MAKKSITKRWIFNNLGVIVLALLVIEMVVIYAIQSYFYNSAKQYLVSKLNAVTSVLSIHSQDSSANFSAEMRNMLETFNEKDKIELMAARRYLPFQHLSPHSTASTAQFVWSRRSRR